MFTLSFSMAAQSLLALLCEYGLTFSSTFVGSDGKELSDLVSGTQSVFPVVFLCITEPPTLYQV